MASYTPWLNEHGALVDYAQTAKPPAKDFYQIFVSPSEVGKCCIQPVCAHGRLCTISGCGVSECFKLCLYFEASDPDACTNKLRVSFRFVLEAIIKQICFVYQPLTPFQPAYNANESYLTIS